jgi:cytochrome c-type biogenesis protein CcmH
MTKFGSTTRRDFLARIAGASAAAAVMSRTAGAQQRGQMHDSSIVRRDTTNLFAMDQSAARTVQRPPKPGATAVLTTGQRDDLEHRIRCQCGCTLDVFTCRTTDFSCQVSPAMHRDIMGLVEGGYDAQEIIDVRGNGMVNAREWLRQSRASTCSPGSRRRRCPPGGAAILMVLRRWNAEKAALAAARRSVPSSVSATSDELARLDAAVRGDDSRDRRAGRGPCSP